MPTPDVKKIADFMLNYATYTDRETLEEKIKEHIEYKTYFLVYDINGNIHACCLWNIEGDTAHITDCIISTGYRCDGILRNMLTMGLKMWPDTKYIIYNRDYNIDGHDRWLKDKRHDIHKFLRRLE